MDITTQHLLGWDLAIYNEVMSHGTHVAVVTNMNFHHYGHRGEVTVCELPHKMIREDGRYHIKELTGVPFVGKILSSYLTSL